MRGRRFGVQLLEVGKWRRILGRDRHPEPQGFEWLSNSDQSVI